MTDTGFGDAAIVVRTISGTAAELHALEMPTEGQATELWVMRPTGPAVVMGSAQRPEAFDEQRLAAEGIALAPRRSGGGAVFIDPAATVWIDVLAPKTSPFWSSELAENFLIVGRRWQHALRTLGVESELCVASPERTDESAAACWAGAGWGELLVGAAKIVGLSQRRTRWGSRVQAMAVIDGSSGRVADYLATGGDRVADAIATHRLTVSQDSLEAAVIDAFRLGPDTA